jgi:TerC family integral membrane protein
MPAKKALKWVIFWVSIAILFNLGVYAEFGKQKAMEFLAGYLIEEFLSVDNLFVFLVLFNYFKIPPKYQRKVLNWGIAGVIVLRGIFILLGVALINQFAFVLYFFGAILIYSGYKMVFSKEKEIHPEQNKVLKLFRKFMKTTHELQGNSFFIKKQGMWFATPLFVCLLVIESTDVVFAIDSIPAIFAITNDPLIIFSSNILAVLGLRSIYFLLSIVADKFAFVKNGVGFILVYVGVKMLLPLINPELHIPVHISLAVILSVLIISVIISTIINKRTSRSGA